MRISLWSLLTACTLAALLAGCGSRFEAPRRDGPPALVDTGAGRQLWLATTQEEERSGGGGRSFGSWRTRHYTHLRLEAHDPATAQRLWLKTLLVARDDDHGTGGVRILGQEGGLVWLWLHDQVVALAAKDASQVADRALIERANPELRGLLPTELRGYYAWAGALVVKLADGRRVRIRPGDFRAEPYVVGNEDAFIRLEYMTGTWNGAYETRDFGVLHGVFDGRWIGLLGDGEAKEGENDRWGENHFDSANILEEHKDARRSFRLATTAVHAAPGGERFTRIVSLPRIEGTQTWLEGRMLMAPRDPGAPTYVERDGRQVPAPRAPLRLHDPDGVLVLHRTRIDAQGRLALSRIGPDFRAAAWTSVLPLQQLENRWQASPGQLLLYGSWDAAQQPGMSDSHEALLSVELGSGRWTGWDVGTEQALAPAP